MNRDAQLEELRDLLLNAPDSDASRVVAIVVSLTVAVLVLYLVRRRALREEHTPIWLAVAGGLLVVSLRMDWLHTVTRLMGGWTTSSTLFLFGQLSLLAICLSFAVRLSRTSLLLKTLGQEVAILRAQLEESMDEGEAAIQPGEFGGT